MRPLFFFGLVLMLSLGATPARAGQADASKAPAAGNHPAPVVLLHGLARTSASMQRMARQLDSAGFGVCNIDYPSRHHPIDVLAREHVLPAIRECQRQPTQPIHFVTHSLGGIITRELHARGHLPNIGRVVMLGPPNQGSEVVDKLREWRLFRALNGPAGDQLGTDAQAWPRHLGPVGFELGVIAGRWSVNPLLSMLIPGTDDGKVAVRNTQVDGMRDFLVLPVTHPLMMRNRKVIHQTIHFLRHGRFRPSADG